MFMLLHEYFENKIKQNKKGEKSKTHLIFYFKKNTS